MNSSPIPFRLTEYPPDRFQLMELLGQGGMGQVYRARDRHLNRPVALKFVRSQESPELLVRLLLEAQFQASLDHPHIVKVYGVGSWEGRTCVVMQLVDGTTLDQIALGLDVPQRIRLVVQAARGMHTAHLHGLIHRDVKPHNILVERNEGGDLHAFVTDFGLARATDTESLSLSGAILGSPHYMSPEQAMGGRLVDARTDIYSLGATLYAVLAGRPPFGQPSPDEPLGAAGGVPAGLPDHPLPPFTLNDRDTPLAVLRQVLDEQPLPPRRLNEALSEDMETIILQCLEKDPKERYSPAEALADDLECALEGNPIRAKKASWPRRARAWARRHPTLASVLASGVGVGLVALVLGGVLLQRTRLKAEIAARFLQAAQDVETRFRMAALSPQQNRSQEVAQLLEGMKAKHEEAKALGSLAAGPGAYFQGQALLLLGRNREAFKELQKAWDLGFRASAVARALGTALLEVHAEEAQRLTGTGPERTAGQLALAEKYLRPAMRCFQQGAEGGERRNLDVAKVAFLEDRDEAALTLAGQELRATPWSYEAQELRHQVWARRASRTWDPATFEAHAREAESHVQTLLDIARGDPRTYLTAARWWLVKAESRAYRFRSFQPDLVHRSLDLAATASHLDPMSPAPMALRAKGWSLLAEFQREMGCPDLELAASYDQAFRDADRALVLDPTCISALLTKGFTLLRRRRDARPEALDAGHEDPWRDWNQALQFADQVIRLEQRVPEAYRLKGESHRVMARLCALRGEDNYVHNQALAESSREAFRLWPEVMEYGIRASAVLRQLAFQEATLGRSQVALDRIQEARRILEVDLNRTPRPPELLLQLIIQARIEGDLEGFLGRSPSPFYAKAEEALAALPPDLLQHPDFHDEVFTVAYEQAALAVERGNLRADTFDRLERMAQHKRSLPWIALNQATVWRLRGLNEVLRGADPSRWVNLGLQSVRSAHKTPMARVRSMWLGTEGALQIQGAQGLRGKRRAEWLAEGRRNLSTALALDYVLSWTLRQELKMAKEN